MTPLQLQRKSALTCPRCGAPSSERSVLCEPHRLEAAARQARYVGRVRPDRRRRARCAFCEAPSATYRCEQCAAKRLQWDAGLPPADRHQAHQVQEGDQRPVRPVHCAELGVGAGPSGSTVSAHPK